MIKKQGQKSKSIAVPTGTYRRHYYTKEKLQSETKLYKDQHADEVVLMPKRPLISKKGRQVELALLQQFDEQILTNAELQISVIEAEDKVQRCIAQGKVPGIAIPLTIDVEQFAKYFLGRPIVGGSHKSSRQYEIIHEETVSITYKNGTTKKVKIFGGALGEYCIQVHPYQLPTKRAGKNIFVDCLGKMAEVKSIYYIDGKLKADILIYEGLYTGIVNGSQNLANFKCSEQYIIARAKYAMLGEALVLLEELIPPYRDSEIRKAIAKRKSIYEQASNATDTATKNKLLARAQQTRAHRNIKEVELIKTLKGNKTYEVQTIKNGKAYASPRYSTLREDIKKVFDFLKATGIITDYTPNPTDQPSKAKDVIYTIYYENVEPTQLIIQEPTATENATKKGKKRGK